MMNNTANIESIAGNAVVELNGAPFVPARDAARLLGTTPASLAVRRCKDPDSLHWEKSGHNVFYPISEVQRFAEERGIMLHTGGDHAPDQAPDGAVYLTINQMAARWQCSVYRVNQLRREDSRFPNPLAFGRIHRWAVSDVEVYEQQLKGEGVAA